MIQTSKKTVLAFILAIVALFNVFSVPVLASEAETTPMEIVTIELLSEDDDVLATFSSQAEFEIYIAGVSPMYESCGTGPYWHGQYTYTIESLVKATYTDGYGNITILYMIYVQEYCSSCDGLINSYYRIP